MGIICARRFAEKFHKLQEMKYFLSLVFHYQ